MSDKNKKQVIGLFGFGAVGEGLYHVLQNSHTTNAIIKRICVKDRHKKRGIASEIFTFDANDILNDPEVNLVVELINDAEASFEIVKSALLKGKSVVTGNKKMLAFNLPLLVEIQQKTGTALLYDASACGSIPVIRNLEEYYDNDLLLSITGILNGSSNFVLTKVFNENQSYSEALAKAQQLGFAESDPTLDMDGWDALYKIVILALHGFGTFVDLLEVFATGISNIGARDIKFAKEKGYKIKLVAEATKINANKFNLMVMPKMVTRDEYIYNVEDEYNGVIINGAFYEKQFMFGKGAGGHPTGSSVLSDITARNHGYKYEYKKQNYFNPPQYTNDVSVKIYLRYNNQADFNHFEFESIEEQLISQKGNWVIGNINLATLIKTVRERPGMDIFLAYFEKIV